MSRWQEWAREAHEKLKLRAHMFEPNQLVAIFAALEHIETTGDEPYFSLKAFVAVQLDSNLNDD